MRIGLRCRVLSGDGSYEAVVEGIKLVMENAIVHTK